MSAHSGAVMIPGIKKGWVFFSSSKLGVFFWSQKTIHFCLEAFPSPLTSCTFARYQYTGDNNKRSVTSDGFLKQKTFFFLEKMVSNHVQRHDPNRKKTKQQKNWGVFFWAPFFQNATYWFIGISADATPFVGGRTVSCGLQGGVVLCFFDRSSYLRLNIQKIASVYLGSLK